MTAFGDRDVPASGKARPSVTHTVDHEILGATDKYTSFCYDDLSSGQHLLTATAATYEIPLSMGDSRARQAATGVRQLYSYLGDN